jgi:hypothetical protein
MTVGAAITREDCIDARDYSEPVFDENILTQFEIYFLST